MKNIVIIGAGAAGLMAAITSAENKSNKVTLLEKNERAGRKLMITGKGRCNLCNNCDTEALMSNIPKNSKFLYSAFSSLTPHSLMDMFETWGVPLKTERGNRVFPVSDKAVDIVDALVNCAKKSGVKTITATAEKVLTSEQKVIGVKLGNGDIIPADSVILATGGMSYPLTGSTGDGYKLGECVGHTVTPPTPSLVPLETEEDWVKRLQGLSLKNVSITIRNTENYKEVYSDFGEMLFTHFGVSGPIILSASSHLRDITPGKYELSIDLKPALSEEKLDERVLKDFAKYSNKALGNALQELLPRKLIPVIVSLSGIEPDLRANKITRDMRKDLLWLLKNLTCTIKCTRPIDEAIVTAGGIKTNEIDPKTMQSKKIRGLYFAGEVIDVDAYTGGFNLQIAFSTGALAGNSVGKGE